MMKKNIFYAGVALFSACALTACSNNGEETEAIENQEKVIEVTLSASMGADTRTYVSETETNGTYDTYWSKGDKIYVWGTNATDQTKKISGTLELTNYTENQATGTFHGLLSGTAEATDLKYALYPDPVGKSKATTDITELFAGSGFSVNENDDVYQYILKSRYTYGEEDSNAPMFAVSTETNNFNSTIKFQHLCPVVRILLKSEVLNNATQTTNGNELARVKLSDSYVIAGSAAVVVSGESAALKMMNKTAGNLQSVTYVIPSSAMTSSIGSDNYYILDIPVPVGFHSFNVDLTYKENGSSTVVTSHLTQAKQVTLEASDLLIMTYDSRSVEAGGKTETTGEENSELGS